MSPDEKRRNDALTYHETPQPGKIEVVPTKPVSSMHDLSLAYSPGVAAPCQAIAANKEEAFRYSSKGNLVGVITNGSAVLGLGDIGPEASKPVMEGKGVLFKKFAGIDVFDIEVNSKDPEEFVRIVQALEPTFGGINLEDIKAPESFHIERELKQKMNIPVMHDDQHGTAIISGAAMLNALEIVNKRIEDLQLVVVGAGTAAVACTNFYLSMGMQSENIIMVDKDGVLCKEDLSEDDYRYKFATDRPIHSMDEAFEGADMFLGLSVGNIVSSEQLMKMNNNPIVFALANPEPEIDYRVAKAARPDLIMATGRSDYPNQVNNVLCFPYLFRGALDVRATAINEEMKLAVARALAALAKETVPDIVNQAYSDTTITFGREYLIPKPLDPRLISTLTPAVAKAAMDSGVARTHIKDWSQYHLDLLKRVGIGQKLLTRVFNMAKSEPKRLVYAEANNYKILKAAQIVRDEGIATPILLGSRQEIEGLMREHHLDLFDCQIIDPREEDQLCERYGHKLYEKRKRKGVTPYTGTKLMRDRNYFGAMMVEMGLADAMVTGQTKDYPKVISPALQVIGPAKGVKRAAGLYILNTKNGNFFFADTTVNMNPTVEEIVSIIGITANAVRFFGEEPKIALLSYSNFGSSRGEVPEKMIKATELAKRAYPDLCIDGEMQANVAISKHLLQENYPFSELANTGANTLIFPNLTSGNIAYKLLQEVGTVELIGPVLMGMCKPIHIMQMGGNVRDIVNMSAIAVIDAQSNQQPKLSFNNFEYAAP